MTENNNLLDKNYDHKQSELSWQEKWIQDSVYTWNENSSRDENYVIDTPPPTVSGMLHMGHIFSYTQADFIARFQRMKGKNVFYPIGFDDNGLPTERLVEKIKKVRAHQMSREDFIKLCQEIVQDAEEEFRKLFKSVGLSFDWNQEYQTISKQSMKMSQLSFIDLYNKNKIYRKPQPCLWDVADQTALSQAEIEDHDQQGTMYDIKFTLEKDGSDIIIATTRPELIPANVAIFYHPEDPRYLHLKNQYALSPLFKVRLPIIADEKVDQEKGSGLVMCSTFGDITDMDWWRTHNLPLRIIVNKYGKISNLESIGKEDWLSIQDPNKLDYYIKEINDLKLKDAKLKIVELLKAENLLTSENNINQTVKCGERSGTPLEILVTSQWFIKVLDIKSELKEMSNKVNWHPEHMRVRIEQWIDGLQWDWCISRQRYFGVPFPVWYSKRKGEEGKVLVADIDQLPINPLIDLPKGYSKEEIEPDYDVMDTWATSSISPQLSSLSISDNYFIDKEKHKKLYPFDLRPQAHEIIRTWAFGTITKSFLHEQTIPWKNIMISGWCLAADKTKMSKSKGNIVTPVDLIQEKGADAVRYWASTASLGSDIVYSEELFKIGRKLITKLWNASKFVEPHIANIDQFQPYAKDNKNITIVTDKWILSKLHLTIKKATDHFEKYEYWRARAIIEDFFWNDFCDNYLEIVKVRAYGELDSVNLEDSLSAKHTIYYLIHGILHLLSPFIPFVCEDIYSKLFNKLYKKSGSIHRRGSWLDANYYSYDEDSIISGTLLLKILEYIRKIKTDNNLSLKAELDYIRIFINNEIMPNIKHYIIPIINDLSYVTQSNIIELKDNNLNNSEQISLENLCDLSISYSLKIQQPI